MSQSNCAHEHHEHGGHHRDHSHDEHDHDGPDRGEELSLYAYIDHPNIQCLNESTPNAGRSVFKAYQDRLANDPFVQSECDGELLFTVPFTGSVKLKSITVRGAAGRQAPSKMRVWINSYVDFDTCESMAPMQEWELVRDAPSGAECVDYPTRMTKFSNVQTLSILFPSNFGIDAQGDDECETRVEYVGLKGEFQSKISRDPVVTVYELNANPADHKTPAEDLPNYSIQ